MDWPLWDRQRHSIWPDSTLKTITEESNAVAITIRPSPLWKATPAMGLVGRPNFLINRSRWAFGCPDRESHTQTIPSTPPVTNRCPSGLNARLNTVDSLRSETLNSSSPVVALQTVTAPFPEAAAT